MLESFLACFEAHDDVNWIIYFNGIFASIMIFVHSSAVVAESWGSHGMKNLEEQNNLGEFLSHIETC